HGYSHAPRGTAGRHKGLGDISRITGLRLRHRSANLYRRWLVARRRGLINQGVAAMGQVGFGQPDDGVMQMCYLVPDIHAAMSLWVTKLNVGPWFLLNHFTGTDPKYRGRDCKADVSLAMS